ncbi:MAG TPA: pyridoxal phosphate-dependent aminotransferase [Ignavibacteriaceae bacterium]|nr:pyridoxal phosphate-dependent aminotransferase [Ignavibacteriaceae bacterium]
MNRLSDLISSIEESRTVAVSSLAKRLKAEGKDVLNFGAGEPDFNTPDFIKEAAIKAIQNNFTTYTPNEGYPDLIKAIIKKFKDENGLDFKPENILVSNGVKHSLYNILMAICNPGDEVVYQSPYWVSYPEMTKLVKGKSVIIDAGVEKEYKISPEDLEKAITPKTKVFIFNTPSNPTGVVYNKKEILAFAELFKDKDIFIISDEIYEKIVFDGEKHFAIGSVDYLKDKTITLNGVSKAYAMTGWRIGYAGGPKEIIKLARNLQSHSTSNAASISQAASYAALSQETDEINKMVEEFKQRRDFIVAELNKIKGIKCPMPKGAFYVFYDVSSYYGKHVNGFEIKDSTSFCNYLLNEQSVGLVPGIAFGNDKCVRMSYACSQSQIEKGLERINKALVRFH